MATAMVTHVAAERAVKVEVEEEEEEVADGCELENKRRRGLGLGEKSTEVVDGYAAPVAGVDGGDRGRSLYFDEGEGLWKCRHCTWVYHLGRTGIGNFQNHKIDCQKFMDAKTLTRIKGNNFSSSDVAESRSSEIGHFVAEKNQKNLNSEQRVILDDIQNTLIAEENQTERNIRKENDPDKHHVSAKKGDVEIISTEPKTKASEPNGTVKVVKLDETELDLEKVLEEQETHDLFCPNCHSCITRRVILHKRKRVAEVPYVERPEKQRQVEPEVSAASTSIGEASQVTADTSQDNEPDVFRCLSCLSIFVPTENGFNIFRIFGKKEQGVSVQVPSVQHPGQTPARNENWLYSIFKSDSSWKTKNVAGDSLLESSHVASDSGFQGQNKQKSSVLVSSETAVVAATLAPVEVDNLSRGDKNVEENQSTPALPVSVPAKVGTNYATNGNINGAASTELPLQLEVSPVTEYIKKDVCRSPALPFFEATQDGEACSPRKHKIPDDGIVPVMSTKPTLSRVDQSKSDAIRITPIALVALPKEEDDIKPILVFETPHGGISLSDQNIGVSAPTTVLVPQDDVQIHVSGQILVDGSRENQWEVLKSIIYGGLIESITSLGVISSAAGAQSSTLKVVGIGIASLIGSFFVFLNGLSELKNNADASQKDEQAGPYWKLLGRRSNFRLHSTVAIVSFVLMGLLPPLVYGFSFRESDNKEYKLIAVATASLLCISLLAVGKARVSEPRTYIKTLLYYLGLCFTASGISYVAGVLISRFLEQLGLFEHDSPELSPPSIQSLGSSQFTSWAYQ